MLKKMLEQEVEAFENEGQKCVLEPTTFLSCQVSNHNNTSSYDEGSCCNVQNEHSPSSFVLVNVYRLGALLQLFGRAK